MKKYFPYIILILCLFLNGCAVFMAATKKGTSQEKLQEGRTRSYILSQEGVEILDSKRTEEGELIEDYRVQFKSNLSGFRAVGHGVLDVFTLGLWEVIGTPAEGVLRGETAAIRVYYDKNDVIKKIERLE